jgi:RNA recognition motif-containing protein
MNIKDRILLRLFFPYYTSPTSSRFESFFINLNQRNINKRNIYESFNILPERIVQGEDRRTTILIKNIPKSIKKKEIRSMVGKYGNINFLEIEPDPDSIYFNIAYLNVINYKSIVAIYMGLRKHTFNYFNKNILIKIYYSNIQGKEELKKLFKVDYYGNK